MLLHSTRGKSPPKKTTGLPVPTLLPACTCWGYHECPPRVSCCTSPPKPSPHTPFSPSQSRCQLKPSSSPGGPQLMLSTAQLGHVPALFTSFFSSPPRAASCFPPRWGCYKRSCWVPRSHVSQGAREAPKSSSGAVPGGKLLELPEDVENSQET